MGSSHNFYWSLFTSVKQVGPFHHLIVDGPLFLFVPENFFVRDNVRIFELRNDWWGFNEMPLCSPLDSSLTTHFKLYTLLVI